MPEEMKQDVQIVEIPHRVQIALARILAYVDAAPRADFPKSVLNELLDVWEHHSIKPKSPEQNDIDTLLSRFAEAVQSKLYAAEEKYGWRGGWKEDGWQDKLREDIRTHVEKGDPRDVAAYCAFAWHHGWSLSQQPSLSPVEVGELKPPCALCDGSGKVMRSSFRHSGSKIEASCRMCNGRGYVYLPADELTETLISTRAALREAERQRDEAQAHHDGSALHKMYVWREQHNWIAIAHARSVQEARDLVVEDSHGEGDDSTPVRQRMIRTVREMNPEIHYRGCGEAVLQNSGELEEEKLYSETWKNRAEAAEARVQELEAVAKRLLPYQEEQPVTGESLAASVPNELMGELRSALSRTPASEEVPQ